jgi:DNA-binding NarL/FixJ family response regulator
VRQSLRTQEDLTRVLVVTPDNMLAELLKGALDQKRKNFVVETLTGSSQKIMEEVGVHKMHVAVISQELQDGPSSGIKVLEKLVSSRHTPVIMLLQSAKPGSVVNAFRGGARGIFYRSHSLKALSKCIQTVRLGQIWASNEDLEHVLTALIQTKPPQFKSAAGMSLLTRREEEVVRLVADGLRNREIAEQLKVKEHSIRNYLYRIYEKLGVSTRVELILYAFGQRNGSDSSTG